MKVLNISTECFPAAKAGGMGDVVGALPKYLPEYGIMASVVTPKYSNKWFLENEFDTVFTSRINLGNEEIAFSVQELKENTLEFPFYAVDIPGKFDRSNIYLDSDGTAYDDEVERNLSFQLAILTWLSSNKFTFDLLHCHDHMTGLIPFMIQHCLEFECISNLPVFFTIHNGQYRGSFSWDKKALIPDYPEEHGGLLDWDGRIHSLAAAIKCAQRVSTVSPSYMEELIDDFDSLTSLMRFEKYKSVGILNGIDTELWDPQTDALIHQVLKRSSRVFKKANKKYLANAYGFKSSLPLFSFIGRFAFEKAADLLSGSIETYLTDVCDAHFFILGSGDKSIEEDVLSLQRQFPDNVTAVIAYNEKLAHQIYAASDFILMPSRFEPCGLNQMYAMRYGTIPVVRHTGGLKNTVPDIGDEGNGISFLRANHEDIVYSIGRAMELYNDQLTFQLTIDKIMKIDFSWDKSARKYSEEYDKLIKSTK